MIGYNLKRNNEGDYVFENGTLKYIILIKNIESPCDEGFPNNSIGTIFKKYFFTDLSDPSKKAICKIETEIYLLKDSNLSTSEIKNCYKKIKNDIVKINIKNNYTVSQTSNKLNYKSIFSNYYDIIEESIIEKPISTIGSKDVYIVDQIYSNGECFETKKGINYCFLTFILKDKTCQSYMI